MSYDDKDKKYKRKYVILISILLIAIIILLLFCRFGRIENQGLIPTGNVDVFDIDIYCNHRRAQVPSNDKQDYGKNNNNSSDNTKNENKTSENIADNGNKTNNNNETKNDVSNEITNETTNEVSNEIANETTNEVNNEIANETTNEISNETENENIIEEFAGITFDEEGRRLPLYDEEKDKNTLGVSFINQQEGNYIFQQRLNIFTNAAYQYTTKIAPGVSNTYHFVVHNSNTLDVKYIMEMYEESEYPVNLKYRLKNGNIYEYNRIYHISCIIIDYSID